MLLYPMQYAFGRGVLHRSYFPIVGAGFTDNHKVGVDIGNEQA
ncbi:hypothetical protein SPWS13_0948 [Shewanella putrefaciens]|nr:hypothetical protein SPWS13_0948 [Shewanella putrefaciens]